MHFAIANKQKQQILKPDNFCIKLIKITLAILLAFSMLSTYFSNPDKAFAMDAASTSTWKDTINAQINTDGSISVNESKIIDVTKFIEKAKKYNPSADQNKDQSSQTKEESSLQPLVWNYITMPEKCEISVSNMAIGLINSSDAIIGNAQNVPSQEFSSKWRGNQSPSTQCYSYDAQYKQINLYTQLVNSSKVTAKEAYDIVVAYTGTTDTNLWDTTKAHISVNYTILRAAMIYKDVADFSWIYLSDTWKGNSYNVDLTVTVPVGPQSISSPLGKVTSLDTKKKYSSGDETTEEQRQLAQQSDTTERNIYAWGHGSSGGIVDLDPNGIVSIKNDIVPGGTDAEVRIVFPAAWLTNLDKSSDITHANQTKLASILKEESVWRDWRTNTVMSWLGPIIFIPICVLLTVIALVLFVKFSKKKLVKSIEKSEIDELHPSILVRIKNWNMESEKDLIGSILYLNDCKVIKITKEKDNDFYIEAVDEKIVKNALSGKIDTTLIDEIDARTLQLLFKTCSPGSRKISLDEFTNVAKVRYEDFLVAYYSWQLTLDQRMLEVAKFDRMDSKAKTGLFITSGIWALITIIIFILTFNIIILASGIITSIAIAFIANFMRNKLYIVDKTGKEVDASSIGISLAYYSDTIQEFITPLYNALNKAICSAQDNHNLAD